MAESPVLWIADRTTGTTKVDRMTRRKILTVDQVRQIRALHLQGKVGYETLAKKFGVGASTIRDCVKYWTYAGVR